MEKTLRQEASDLIKVVLFGPESSGKTTLAKALAAHYETIWIPEFARDYLQKKMDTTGDAWDQDDLLPIAQGQIQLENRASKIADKLLFCDTDLLETMVYSEQHYGGYVDAGLKKAALQNSYDLYLLTYIDTPWIADDLRDRPEQRAEMFRAFEYALKTHDRPYILVQGNMAERMQQAKAAIDSLL